MKKLYATTLLVFFFSMANAKIWRVNNNTGIAADFTTAQAAHDGASAGDTLHFEPSLASYGSVTITKKLVLIGIGTFLNINPNQQASGLPSYLDNITINNGGASGSVIMVPFTTMFINAVPNLVVQRSYIGNRIEAIDADNLVVRNCYFNNEIVVAGGSTNVLFHNNILRSQIIMDNSSSGTFLNNVINLATGNSTFYNSTVRSNIFIGGSNNFFSSVVQNNLANSTNIPAGSGNIQNVNMNTVFINHNSHLDKDLQLAPGSPAIGAGYGGVDAGAFGGGSPYVLSVQPNVPSIYKLTAPPTVSGSTMQVTISTRSNN